MLRGSRLVHRLAGRHASRGLASASAAAASSFSAQPHRRVVVTGMGLVTPFGTQLSDFWERLSRGESVIKTIADPDITVHDLPARVAASVTADKFNSKDWVSPAYAAITSRFEAFAVAAAALAVKDSGWVAATPEEQERAGVAIGSGIGCVEEVAQAGRTLAASQRGSRKLSPYSLPKFLANLGAGQVSIHHSLKGPNHCVSTACTTGAHSLGDAYRFIKYDDADVMVAGAAEAGVTPLSLALFSKIHALSRNADAATASRPFGAGRDGFVMGEGAGVVVLEELTHAQRRGARIYAEIVGYGLSSDAHHVTSPPDDGAGAVRCMRAALRSAGLAADDVDYLNAHATSTPQGDLAEARAIKAVFGDVSGGGPVVSSTKGALGHMLGSAGAVEAIISILTLQTQRVAPTIGLKDGLDDEVAATGVRIAYAAAPGAGAGEEDGVPQTEVRISGSGSRSAQSPSTPSSGRLRVAMSNSFGFGGSNASLIFKAFDG